MFPSSRDRAYNDNAKAPRRLVDPGATPRGGVFAYTTFIPYQQGGNLYANGSGLSPNRTVSFHAVGLNGVAGPGWLGWLTADSSGAISGFVTELFCHPGQTRRVILVAVDEGSGVVTTAGDTDVFRRGGW